MSEPPEGSGPALPSAIVGGRTSPLTLVVRLLGGVAVVLVAGVVVLGVAASHLARFVPFSAEVAATQRLARVFPEPGGGPVEPWLRGLTARVVEASGLPDGTTVTVHFVKEDAVNAFATLGGHVVVYAGLLERLGSENAAAMVIAHEVAHVKLRHPASSMGRGMVTALAVTVVSVASGADMVGRILGPAGLFTVMRFSPEQERDADMAALEALVKVHGHAGGAADLLRSLDRDKAGLPRPPAFLSTHPLDGERIAAIDVAVKAKGWPAQGEVRPVPADVRAAVRTSLER